MTTVECIAVHVDEVEEKKVILSECKTKKWTWKEDDGSSKSRTQSYAEVYYGKKGNKLTFTLSDNRTINGIQTTRFKSAFMSLNLSSEQSAHIKTQLDNLIFQRVFENRATHLKRGTEIEHPSEIRLMYQGIIKKGDLKPDGSGDRWNDQITCTVPTKRKGQQTVVDENLCTIEDLEGRPYAWTALDRKDIKEVCIEVDRIVFAKDIKVVCKFRLIVPNAKTAPRVMTKRKLLQRAAREKEDEEKSKGGSPNTSSSSKRGAPVDEESTITPPSKKVRTLPESE